MNCEPRSGVMLSSDDIYTRQVAFLNGGCLCYRDVMGIKCI